MLKYFVRPLAVAGALCVLAVSTRAEVIVTVGDHQVNPGASIVIPIEISASAAEVANSLVFYAEIFGGDSGKTAPVFSAVSFAGTIFAAAPVQDTVTNGGGEPVVTPNLIDMAGAMLWDIINPPWEEELNGTLIYVTVDASGADLGTWDLRIMGVEFPQAGSPPPGPPNVYDTALYPIVGDVSFTAPDGSITVVPEPASMVLLALASGALLLRRRRR